MKKILSILLASAMILTLFAGCGNGGSDKTDAGNNGDTSTQDDNKGSDNAASGDVKLTFMTNIIGEQAATLEEVIKQFTEETGIPVEYSAPGGDFEGLMKTKMAANELPDVFTTHGWSVLRYSEYMEPINDQPFAEKIVEQMKPVISNKDGEMFVLPVDADVAGIVYNVDVVESAGVDVDSIKTWDDFAAACDKLKESGVDPIHVGGKDDWTVGQFGDLIAPSFFVTNENNNKREELKSGTFDAATWEQVGNVIDSWVTAGYFNSDALTADYNSSASAMGQGKAAFGFYGNSFIVDAKAVNPDANFGMMPIPAATADDEPSLIAGERIAVGVWKDSPNKDAALELLNYLAKPENTAKIATSSGNPTGLNDSASEIGDIQTYIDKYASVRTFPYFDREYLPSGMWDVMCSTNVEIFAQNNDAVANAAKVMEQNFSDKFVQ